MFSVVVTSAASLVSSAGYVAVCTWAFFFALNLSINSTTIDEATIISATSPATLSAFKNLLILFSVWLFILLFLSLFSLFTIYFLLYC